MRPFPQLLSLFLLSLTAVFVSSEAPAMEVNGWLNGGWYGNEYGALENHVCAKYDKSRPVIDQLALQVNKVADGSKGLDWGFNTTFLYGGDARNYQAAGDKTFDYRHVAEYELAIPDLYMVLACRKLSVRIGHFLSDLGYENTYAPESFFISHVEDALTMETHTGTVFIYQVAKEFDFYCGWINGNDNGFEFKGGNALFTGLDCDLTKKISAVWMMTYGRQNDRNAWPENFSFQSIILKYAITSRLQFDVEYGYGDYYFNTNGKFTPSVPANQTHPIINSINTYLYFTRNARWSHGLRVGWQDNNDRGSHTTECNVTLGHNWKWKENITLRNEVRYDTVNVKRFDDGNKKSQWAFAIDAVIVL